MKCISTASYGHKTVVMLQNYCQAQNLLVILAYIQIPLCGHDVPTIQLFQTESTHTILAP